MPAAAPRPSPAQGEPVTYLNCDFGWRSWLAATDHKRIAILFLPAILLMMGVAGAMAAVMRAELATPTADLVSPDTYDKLFTMHGMIMVWFALLPAIPAILGNFIAPLMIGARSMAFPWLNRLSWYLYVASGIWIVGVLIAGGVDTNWTLLAPYSAQSSTPVSAAIIGLVVNALALLLIAINQLVTVHTMRAPGMTWWRMPVFAWTTYATSAMLVVATPVLAITLLSLALERSYHVGLFGPTGSSAATFQQMFWMYGGPAVYIMALPAIGVITEVVSAFSAKRVFGYRYVWASIVAIAALAFTIWGRHMEVSGLPAQAAAWFSFASYLIAVPCLVILFSWLATLYRGSILLSGAMVWALAAVGSVLIGGVAGLIVSNAAANRQLHDTYFVSAHFHYAVSGVLMAFLAGLHYWWPKMTGRMYSEAAAKFGAIVVFVGVNLTYLPYFVAGISGLPRRYVSYPPEFQIPQVLSTAGTTILIAGYLIAFGGLLFSLWRGAVAGPNPWRVPGLEWTTDSPPLPDNFEAAATIR